jgi:hypothetical protein
VADLVPVVEMEGDEWELSELERRGIARRGAGGVDPQLLQPGPRAKGPPTSKILVEERRSGR